jgi:hypothetical protein
VGAGGQLSPVAMKAVLRWWQPILLAAAVAFADDYDSVPGLQHGQPLFEVPLTVGGEENASYSLVVKVGDRINQVAKQWCIENNARSSEVSSCCAPGRPWSLPLTCRVRLSSSPLKFAAGCRSSSTNLAC